MARIARLAQLRRYLADDIRAAASARTEIRSRDTAVAIAAAGSRSPGSGDVHFADVQVFIESETAAHAYLAVELTSLDRESGHPIVDSRDASVSLAKQDGEWVITAAESKELPAFTDRGDHPAPASATALHRTKRLRHHPPVRQLHRRCDQHVLASTPRRRSDVARDLEAR